MTVEQQSFFELIRREGLIVVALAALIWQVYWMTTGFSEADKLWREEIAAWRTASMETDRARTEAKVELAAAIQQAEDRIAHVEDIAERMEQECKLLMTIDALDDLNQGKNE